MWQLLEYVKTNGHDISYPWNVIRYVIATCHFMPHYRYISENIFDTIKLWQCRSGQIAEIK